MDSLNPFAEEIYNTNSNVSPSQMNPFSENFTGPCSDAEPTILDSHKSGENAVMQFRFAYDVINVEGRHTLADSDKGVEDYQPVHMNNWNSGGDHNSLTGADCNTFVPTNTFFSNETLSFSSEDECYKEENFDYNANKQVKQKGVINPLVVTIFKYTAVVFLAIILTYVFGRCLPSQSYDNENSLRDRLSKAASDQQDSLAGGSDNKSSSCWCGCCSSNDSDDGASNKFMGSYNSTDENSSTSCWNN